MKDLPARWQRKPLEDVAEVILGQSPPGASYNESGEGIPFFQGKAEFGALYPTVRKWTTEPKKLANKDDVLISVRAPVGPTNLAPLDCSVGRGLAALRPPDGMPTKYLLYALRVSVDALASQATGTTFAAVSGRQLRAHEIVVAPADEQQHIVEAIEEQLSRLDAGVESLHRASRNLNRMRASVLKAATNGDLVGSTRGSWETVPIREVAVRVDYGSSAKAYADIEGVPMLRMGNIRDGKIVLDDLKFLPSDHPDAEKFSLSPGDVLFNRTNSAELVGKSAVATSQHAGMSFASYLIRLRLGPVVVPEFVAHVINGPLGREYVARVRSQQVGQANVNGTKLAAFPLPIPPIEQQREIVAEVDRQLSLIDSAEAAIRQGVTRAGTLRQSVLQEAFSGGLNPWSSGSVRGAT